MGKKDLLSLTRKLKKIQNELQAISDPFLEKPMNNIKVRNIYIKYFIQIP